MGRHAMPSLARIAVDGTMGLALPLMALASHDPTAMASADAMAACLMRDMYGRPADAAIGGAVCIAVAARAWSDGVVLQGLTLVSCLVPMLITFGTVADDLKGGTHKGGHATKQEDRPSVARHRDHRTGHATRPSARTGHALHGHRAETA